MPDEIKPKHLACSICSLLRDVETAYEHVQSPEDDVDFPEAVKHLKTVRDISNSKSLMQCPQCGTYYFYKSSYEFLIGYGGSYDEFNITRLSDEEAQQYLS
jgi:hypothetical protein